MTEKYTIRGLRVVGITSISKEPVRGTYYVVYLQDSHEPELIRKQAIYSDEVLARKQLRMMLEGSVQNAIDELDESWNGAFPEESVVMDKLMNVSMIIDSYYEALKANGVS